MVSDAPYLRHGTKTSEQSRGSHVLQDREWTGGIPSELLSVAQAAACCTEPHAAFRILFLYVSLHSFSGCSTRQSSYLPSSAFRLASSCPDRRAFSPTLTDIGTITPDSAMACWRCALGWLHSVPVVVQCCNNCLERMTGLQASPGPTATTSPSSKQVRIAKLLPFGRARKCVMAA